MSVFYSANFNSDKSPCSKALIYLSDALQESLSLVKNMGGYDVKIENERERQSERVEALKNKIKERKAARENLAMELLDLAQGIESK